MRTPHTGTPQATSPPPLQPLSRSPNDLRDQWKLQPYTHKMCSADCLNLVGLVCNSISAPVCPMITPPEGAAEPSGWDPDAGDAQTRRQLIMAMPHAAHWSDSPSLTANPLMAKTDSGADSSSSLSKTMEAKKGRRRFSVSLSISSVLQL